MCVKKTAMYQEHEGKMEQILRTKVVITTSHMSMHTATWTLIIAVDLPNWTYLRPLSHVFPQHNLFQAQSIFTTN